MNTFANIVEEIQNLSTDEIHEIHVITEKYLIERRRDEFLKNHEESMNEFLEGKMKFTSNVDELMAKLENL